MNEHPAAARGTAPREKIRSRLDLLRFSRRQGVLGPAELMALAASLLIAVLVIVSYLYFLLPARSRLDTLKLERSRLETQLRNSKDVVMQGQSTDATVQRITRSLDTFESDRLRAASAGRMSLYDSLNQLIRKNGLRNTSGPTYTPLAPAGSKAGASSRSVNTKWQSIYPGIAISVTVEGPYQTLRRFVQDIEANRQFVIINSVELERSTEGGDASAAGEESASGPRGSLVSLRLEMATYFQRGGADIAVESVTR